MHVRAGVPKRQARGLRSRTPRIYIYIYIYIINVHILAPVGDEFVAAAGGAELVRALQEVRLVLVERDRGVDVLV